MNSLYRYNPTSTVQVGSFTCTGTSTGTWYGTLVPVPQGTVPVPVGARGQFYEYGLFVRKCFRKAEADGENPLTNLKIRQPITNVKNTGRSNLNYVSLPYSLLPFILCGLASLSFQLAA